MPGTVRSQRPCGTARDTTPHRSRRHPQRPLHNSRQTQSHHLGFSLHRLVASAAATQGAAGESAPPAIYIEYFKPSGRHAAIHSLFREHAARAAEGLGAVLNLLAVRVVLLAPSPGGIAIWSLPSFAAMVGGKDHGPRVLGWPLSPQRRRTCVIHCHRPGFAVPRRSHLHGNLGRSTRRTALALTPTSAGRCC